MDDDFRRAALDYHRLPRPGKLAVEPTKRMATQRDLGLAYSPGVAAACEAIAADPATAYDYTTRGNMVAVISNGTAVLGLGAIGPEAALPLINLIGGFLTALAAHALAAAFHTGDVGRIIISAMMPMLPGLAMTNAIRDAMRGDLVSGVATAGEALIRAIVLAAGAGLAVAAWMLLVGP